MTVKELTERMRALRSDSGAVLDRALLKAGEKVRARAVLLCPVDTGELRNSIRVQRISPGVAAVGTNKEYAAYVEFGTGTLGDRSVPHTAKQSWRWQDENGNWHTSHGTPAQPFLRPAAVERDICKTIAAELKKAVDNA